MGHNGTLAYIPARCGTRPRPLRETRFKRAYLFGAVRPARAMGAGLVLLRADIEVMNRSLVDTSEAVMPGAHAAFILNVVGRYGSDTLIVPDDVSLVELPPHGPELDPVGNIGVHRLSNGYKHIVDVSCDASNTFLSDDMANCSIAARRWATWGNL